MIDGKFVLSSLLEGNKRFVNSFQEYPNQTRSIRLELKKGQQPASIILGCSDSRVPPEIVFHQGLGDLFVIRVAGNGIDDVVLGSIEYAAKHLHVSLLMVLGHSDCGAVRAAMDDSELDGHLPSVTDTIKEAVQGLKGISDYYDDVVKAQVKITANHLRESKPILADLFDSGRLLVESAFYDFDTGLVEILE